MNYKEFTFITPKLQVHIISVYVRLLDEPTTTTLNSKYTVLQNIFTQLFNY